MSSSFGTLFRVTTFGESHGRAVGAVVDGCPPGLALCEEDIQAELDRRRPGQSALTTERSEADRVRILSGVEQGRTLGTPIGLEVANRDQRAGGLRRDAGRPAAVPRRLHLSDQVRHARAQRRGRASARETIGRVAAGAVAQKWLREAWKVEIVAWVAAVGRDRRPGAGYRWCCPGRRWTRTRCAAPIRRLPRPWAALIGEVREARDSVGGTVACVCRNVPPGLGEPVFDKFEALLAQAMLSIPASKGFEIGSGFAAARMRGSRHNDPFVARGDRLGTATNRSGGVQGGISNGEAVVFRVAFKPPATIGLAQETVDFDGRPAVLEAKGRHDPCIVPRAVPVVESMAALVIADLLLRQQARPS